VSNSNSALHPTKTQHTAQYANATDNSPITAQPAIIAEKKVTEFPQQIQSNNWSEIVAAININGLTRELAHNCVLQNIDDTVCTLILDPGHKQLHSDRTQENLQKALQAYRKTPLKLVITTDITTIATPAVQITKAREDKQQATIDAINSDQNILALKEHLGARVMPGTIEPL
jgi:DNA polymerase-3 subunit gamma/tau